MDRPEVDAADAFEPLGWEAWNAKCSDAAECVAQFIGDDNTGGSCDIDDTGCEVHDGSVVVAVSGEDRTEGKAGTCWWSSRSLA